MKDGGGREGSGAGPPLRLAGKRAQQPPPARGPAEPATLPGPRLVRPPRGAGHAAAALRRSPPVGPLPRRFLSLSQPLPPRVDDVKIPRKSLVVTPRAEARFSGSAAPSPGAWGRARDSEGPFLFLPGGRAQPTLGARRPPPQIILENSLL